MPQTFDKKNKHSSNPLDVHVGARLRFRRMSSKMSQEHLGKQVGITFQQIQKYENGSNRISASRLFEFSRILDVPVSYFYDDLPENLTLTAEKEKTSSPSINILQSKQSIELFQAFEIIKSRAVRQRIVDLVKELSKAKI